MIPALRSDISVHRGPTEWDGMPTWTMHDTVRNKFFRIGWIERAMLRHWSKANLEEIAKAASLDLGAEVKADAVSAFATFLTANQLADASPPPPSRQGALTRLLHTYLFLRIPLGSPDRLVAAATPRIMAVLLSLPFVIVLSLLAFVGLMQTFRQWDVFVATLPPLSSPGGLAMYGAMLILSAVVHEFGHAIATRHFGCRVGTMGIALIVLVPTLYSDTTDTWRLTDSRQRLMVGLAGIAAELLLAILALALWSHLPEGAAQSAAVALATTALATTLIINLSPFMRFDGYFILSDLLGVPNLQERAFALFLWHLRRLLFAMNIQPPETLPPRLRTLLLGWAMIAIPYRAILYLGIALLVYSSVFKLAGLALFAVEIGWFLALPCWREVRTWYLLRDAMQPKRLAATMGLLSAGLLAMATPWSSTVDLPAALEAARHTVLFPPQAGRVAASRLDLGQRFAEGDILLELEAPALRSKLEDVTIRLKAAQWQVDHLNARSSEWSGIRVEEEALSALQRERDDVLNQVSRLEIRAPFAGIVAERDPALLPGRWLGLGDQIAELTDNSHCRVVAYVSENDLGRLAPAATGRFYADGLDLTPVPVAITRIDAASVRRLDDPYFAGDLGGAIAVRRTDAGAAPAQAMFGVRFDAQEGADCSMRRRGAVAVVARSESMLHHLFRLAATKVNAELGF
ncbi:MAG: HlyD family efflux transporter periplasmic adaptor subunit [Alphaproteobacteria bacterium]|nr:HlyD family efflux transporter periplasmic adaptor subunit [Alphaproteobacteria bacterium]